MTLTIRTDPECTGRRIVSKDGPPVADIIAPARGTGMTVCVFGPIPGGLSKHVNDMAEAKELIEAATAR
ncbi:MAG: hypothetical protein WDN48_05920 [Pseudolabrys sp.]